MSKRLLLLSALAAALSGCNWSGAHLYVERIDQPCTPQPAKVMYVCGYADYFWSATRRVAYCETKEECNAICQKLEGK